MSEGKGPIFGVDYIEEKTPEWIELKRVKSHAQDP